MYFFITLRMFLGEIEKYHHGVYKAENEEEARKSALIGECHFHCSEEEAEEAYEEDKDDNQIWDGGMYIYRIYGCDEVPEEDIPVLKKHLSIL